MRPLLLTFLMFPLLIGCSASKPMSIRPITIQVVDIKSKKPLENISVFYVVDTVVFEKYIFFIIPNIHPDIGNKVIYKHRGVTDKNGKVSFQGKDINVSHNERLSSEVVFINIDAEMTTKMAKISKGTLEDYYSSGKVRRDGDVDNIDIVNDYVFVPYREWREEVLVNPTSKYGGAVIVSMFDPSSRQDGIAEGRYERDEYLILYWGGDTLDKNEDLIVVPLQRRGNGSDEF